MKGKISKNGGFILSTGYPTLALEACFLRGETRVSTRILAGSSILTQMLCCGENLVASDKAYVNRIQMDLAN